MLSPRAAAACSSISWSAGGMGTESSGAAALPKCRPQRVAMPRSACALFAPIRRSRSTLSMLTPRPPSESCGAFGPAFRRAQEVRAVVHELPPAVPRNITGWPISVQASNPLNPIAYGAVVPLSALL
jgi:hypothetical protein